MSLNFVTRGDQDQTLGLTDNTQTLSDELFDGIPIPSGFEALNWIPENAIHQSIVLTNQIDSTRNFLGAQINTVRDEVRGKTWATAIEHGQLSLWEIDGSGQTKSVVSTDNVWRSHIVLDKFSGTVKAAWITNGGAGKVLFFDGAQVATAGTDIDFPFFDLAQAPIGSAQTTPSPYGVLTYKDRSSGTIYYRRFTTTGLDAEQILTTDPTIGGASLAIYDNRVVIRIDAFVGGKIVPKIAESTDDGQTFTSFVPIVLPFDPEYSVLPSPPVVADIAGNFHAPVGARHETQGNGMIADVILDHAIVEAIPVTVLALTDKFAVERFPKKDVKPEPDNLSNPFGNGITDGAGLIMVALSEDGALFTSNSQAGGILYPPAQHLNHEMPHIYGYDSTECYTRGIEPNVVSMDYIYIERDPTTLLPVNGELHLETWDMPLPIPVFTATASGQEIQVHIEQDANFFPGETTFTFLDSGTTITSVQVTGDRDAVVQTSGESPVGKRLRFTVQNVFYYHQAETVVQ